MSTALVFSHLKDIDSEAVQNCHALGIKLVDGRFVYQWAQVSTIAKGEYDDQACLGLTDGSALMFKFIRSGHQDQQLSEILQSQWMAHFDRGSSREGKQMHSETSMQLC
jgi:hypothetical protein